MLIFRALESPIFSKNLKCFSQRYYLQRKLDLKQLSIFYKAMREQTHQSKKKKVGFLKTSLEF